MVLENTFDRGDEIDADKASVQYTQKAGYAPATLADFLTRLDERNKDQAERNGLFASHPETQGAHRQDSQAGRGQDRRGRRSALQAERQVQADAGHLDRRRRGRRSG